MRPIEEQGYLIVATNTETVDYINCARALAESIRRFHPGASICLLTNVDVDDLLFNYVYQLPDTDINNPYANDWQIFSQTPFRETIKLEADMIIASSIDHWWTMFRHRDVVISSGCRTWQDEVGCARNYRQVFDDNNLPDVYNAITYWRRSETARDFFDTVRVIFQNWDQYKRLIKFPDEVPSTDLVYAMAAQIIGPELVTLPFATYPKIVHMKRHIAGTIADDWTKELIWETDPLRINTVVQWGAFHYYVKDWSVITGGVDNAP